MNQTFNSISSEELCKKLNVKDIRSILTTKGFPKPLFNEGEMLFSKEEVLKYFNIENIDENFITTQEAACYLNIGTQHLKNLVLENKIPSYRLKSINGSGHLFRKSELDIVRKINIRGNIEFINHFVGNEIMKRIFLNYIDLYKNIVTIREYEIIYEYFFNGKTLIEISNDLELTPTRVRTIFNKAANRFVRKLSTKNMLNISELERVIIQKDIEINYLRELVKDSFISADEKQVQFNEYKILNTCIGFLSKKLSDEDISVRALNTLCDIDIDIVYSILIKYNTYRGNTKDMMKFRNFGKKTYDELLEYITLKEKEFEKITGISSEEFFLDKPKTSDNLSLFSKIHANFKI